MAKASDIIKQAQAWLGKKESDGSHKVIIDTYNAHKPLARGYKVQCIANGGSRNDDWCATFVSAVAIKCNATNIIPTECGCGEMVALFQKLGVWVENENRTPKIGDIIFYDWQDNGVGDNKGWPDHVGIVEKVSGKTITVIEGNVSDAVGRRTVTVNAKNIRGYAVPKYDAEEVPKKEEPKPAAQKVDYAASKDASFAGTYTTTTSLNLRTGASTSKEVVCVLPKGAKVTSYGYYTKNGNTIWLYVVYNGKVGFCSKKYLKK